MILRQETQLAVSTSKKGSINTRVQGSAIRGSTVRSIRKQWHQPLKQRRGAGSNDESYQSKQSIKPRSVTTLLVYQAAAPSNAAPFLIRLSVLHETWQVRVSRRSQGW